LTAEAEQSNVRETGRAASFRVEFIHDWQQAAGRWIDASSSTPFQDSRWLDAWYAAFAYDDRVEPLIAVISDSASAEPVALLPLVRRVQNGIRIVEFADLDLTDYNAPVLGKAAPRDARTARSLWQDLLTALRRMPDGADLVRLRKMPVDLGGRPNPLALLDGVSSSPVNGNLVTTGDDFDAYRYSLDRTVRKELERSWRVFTRDPAASFQVVTDKAEALRILATMEAQQDARMQALGLSFVLNSEICAAFYRHLVDGSVGNGYAVLSALKVGHEVVAILLGVRTDSRYVMVRISNAGEKWSKCSPGRLVIERTMASLHQEGVRQFDFSIGNYAYKRRFGVIPFALTEITTPLSWRGWPYAFRDRVAREIRRYPRLAAVLGRMLGRPASREEH
jgi:CelD/BcsL family acetyltransferase involved in cellulose biosynthesis